jgi:hypothetical protein
VTGRGPARPAAREAGPERAAGAVPAALRDSRVDRDLLASRNPPREHIRGIDGTGNEAALPGPERAAGVGAGLAGLTRAGDLLGFRSRGAPRRGSLVGTGSRERSPEPGMGSKR